jgi:anti-sigma B factor antagonist
MTKVLRMILSAAIAGTGAKGPIYGRADGPARLTSVDRGMPDDMMTATTRVEGRAKGIAGMARFEATTSDEAGRVRVALTGECDLAVRDELTAALLAAVSRSPIVIVDLSSLDFLDSSGVHGLITAHHAAKRSGRKLFVVNPTGAVATVLELTGVGALLSPPPPNGRG